MSDAKKPIECFKNKITIQNYAEAYRIFDLRHGASSGREWKASVFFVIGLVMLFFVLMQNFNLAKVPVSIIVLLICMYMCTHYLYLLPKRAKLRGEHIYKSSKLLSKPYQTEIYRDYFVMKNDCEYIRKYYAEMSDCIETDDLFVLIGGIEKPISVISKKCLTEEQCSNISELFKKEAVRIYRRTKSSKKRK